MLREQVRHQGGNPQLSPRTTVRTTLPEGVSRDQSSKYQRIASLPVEVFEEGSNPAPGMR